MSAIVQIALKDLRVEYRSKQLVSIMLLLSLVIVLAFRFALGDPSSLSAATMAGLASAALWSSFSFAAIIGMQASFEKEKRNDALEGLLLCPVDAGEVFLVKALANILVVLAVDLLSIVFFAVFFSYDFQGRMVEVIMVAFLGSTSLVLVGTILSALASKAEGGEALLPVLMIPVVLFSVIVPSASATTAFIVGDIANGFGQIGFIGGFAIVYAAVGYAAFEHVLEG